MTILREYAAEDAFHSTEYDVARPRLSRHAIRRRFILTGFHHERGRVAMLTAGLLSRHASEFRAIAGY